MFIVINIPNSPLAGSFVGVLNRFERIRDKFGRGKG